MIENQLDRIIELLEEILNKLYEKPSNNNSNPIDNNKFKTKAEMLLELDDTK